ncbi:MAG: histidinol dehydrogenase [Candidatus Marinimicrobia bacterium]|nr:histidinol dehydrogenase [Candidatus Neomarinimicrobiota bacterium]MDD5709057.1 histidinol dehydrogenase [Candidatus Neomarinimicrobiota bacterium]
MKIYRYPSANTLEELCRRPQIARETLFTDVRGIMEQVRQEGDAALIRLTERYDRAAIGSILYPEAEIAAAGALLSETIKSDIRMAAENIRRFHAAQESAEAEIETRPGVHCWREARPVEKVGLYIPGGSAPLFSSVLMLAIPARLAGCEEIVLCSPPRRDGTLDPLILWSAAECGVRKICRIGGVQAIAAMTFGTESVPAVYKIFGPGNQYVTAAKLLASMEGVAIDMPAGPSEVLIIADQNADPAFVAADLLSQAEHGPDSQVLLLSDDKDLPEKVLEQIRIQSADLPRADIVKESLKYAAIVILKDIEACMDFSNRYAPEHLILQTRNAGKLSKRVRNAGSVFIGPYTPESAGDYASGTNHTLPTSGFARSYSGVSLDAFRKWISFQNITESGLAGIAPSIERMAEAEGLQAHKNAVTLRLKHGARKK